MLEKFCAFAIRLLAPQRNLLGALFTLLIAPSLVWSAAPISPPPPVLQASSFLLIDADTGTVLAEHNANERKAPASLTKIMTGYVVGHEMELGRLGPEEMIQVSVNAWRTGGSKMFIREGTEVSVADLLKGVIIQSGNDASVALAEHIAGNEAQFSELMNQHAERIGMVGTQFRNSTGLPNAEHYSTAIDMAQLTQALIKDYPEQYRLYAEKNFEYNDISQPNRNRLLWRDRTVDGVKTGYTSAAGYCLVASAKRDGMRLISVVMGAENDEARMRESQKLLSFGFRNFESKTVYTSGTVLQEEPVYYGTRDKVGLGVAEDVQLTIPRGYYGKLEPRLTIPASLEAPLAAGQAVGQLELVLGDEVIYQGEVVTTVAVPEGNLLSQLGDAIYLFFDGMQ